MAANLRMLKRTRYVVPSKPVRLVQILAVGEHLFGLDDEGRVFQYLDKIETKNPHVWGWSQIEYDAYRRILG